MAGDLKDTTFQALRDRLRAVITSEFEQMAPSDVASVLESLAAELGNEDIEDIAEASSSQVESSSHTSAALEEQPVSVKRGGWTESLTSRLSQPAVPSQTSRSGGLRQVVLRAETPDAVAALLYQAVEVGAIFVAFADAPKLNDLINVELEFPESQFAVETQGRVVHTSSAGTAVEVSQLDREDRAALEAIYEDHREHLDKSRAPGAVEPSEESYADTREVELSETSEDSDVSSPKNVSVRRTLQGPPPVRMASISSSTVDTEESKDNAFERHKRPSTSVVLGALSPQSRRGDFSVRRSVELTDPDLRVLTSTQRALRDDPWAGKTFGPEASWIEPASDPDRVETLAEERIIDVLLQLSGSGFTGLLEIEGDNVKRQVYFDGGLTVEMTRKPRTPREELGPMLHMADRIDEQQLGMAAAHADENDTTFERSLLELEILDHDRIRHAIAGRITYLLRQTCEVKDGEVRVYDSDSLPAGYLPAPPLRVHVPVERIIFKRLFERLKLLETDERDVLVAEQLDTYPEVAPGERDRLERAVLAEEHSRLVDRIVSGRRRLREVFTESNLSPAETFAVVYALHRMGVLRFDTSLHQTIVRERFRENVTVKYLSVHKASYFEVLNVHWSSYDEVVEKAYKELIEQFDPASVPEAMEPEVHQRVREIRDRIESAYQVLAEREQRHGYRKRIMPEYKLAHAIPLFMKQAELAERRSHWSEALDSLRRVLEIEPDNDKAQLRYARIQDLQDGRLSANPAESSF
ncbi:hypothetical protein FIV42_27800 [Persicimonas caeni]|uniref:J domain-containing protein n=1 Tax=Persicimonas caeni TaxID=2292766 RepID=A0A4Y6Q1F1_PERCE|nr:hypothetical protein [Persicimonas caeni]QDG54411.1 hypothetical protein FIV42_27800 [Persicimonas caeni]QED35632.1 hypothetical protein FRD00_27795 [Persicimonas caeni]